MLQGSLHLKRGRYYLNCWLMWGLTCLSHAFCIQHFRMNSLGRKLLHFNPSFIIFSQRFQLRISQHWFRQCMVPCHYINLTLSAKLAGPWSMTNEKVRGPVKNMGKLVTHLYVTMLEILRSCQNVFWTVKTWKVFDNVCDDYIVY